MERLDKLMDIRDNKIEEATAYKSRKKEQAQVRLQEVGYQAKAARNHKLANLEEQLIYKVMQTRNRLHEVEEQASRIEYKGWCASVDRYDQKMLWKMLGKKEDQLVMVESEFDNTK